jgi:hypothetical protein
LIPIADCAFGRGTDILAVPIHGRDGRATSKSRANPGEPDRVKGARMSRIGYNRQGANPTERCACSFRRLRGKTGPFSENQRGASRHRLRTASGRCSVPGARLAVGVGVGCLELGLVVRSSASRLTSFSGKGVAPRRRKLAVAKPRSPNHHSWTGFRFAHPLSIIEKRGD